MTAALASYPTPLTTAFKNIAIVDTTTGLLTPPGIQLFQQFISYLTGTSRMIPCNCVTSGTVAGLLQLTQFAAGPFVAQYTDYETYVFVADSNPASAVTANLTTAGTPTQTFATIKVYKDGGAAQAGAGDVVLGSLYFATFNDALDSGNGGLVLK